MASNKKNWVLKEGLGYIDASVFGSTSKTYLSGTQAGRTWSVFKDPITSGYQGPDDPVYELAGDFQGLWVQADINMLTDSPIEKVVRAALGLEEDDELQAISYRTKGGEVKIRKWDDG